MLVPSHMPIPLANEACPNKDLPSYVHVRACGFRIYAKMMQLQEVAVCPYVSVYGLFVMHNDTFSIFSCSRLPISCGLLVNAFFNNAIDQIAVVVYNEGQSFLDVVGHLPFSHDQDVCRRFDVGVNKHTDKFLFFGHWQMGQKSIWEGLRNVWRPWWGKRNTSRWYSTSHMQQYTRSLDVSQKIKLFHNTTQHITFPLVGCKRKSSKIEKMLDEIETIPVGRWLTLATHVEIKIKYNSASFWCYTDDSDIL